MTRLRAGDFPESAVRTRARIGAAAAFPPAEDYGTTLFGAAGASGSDWLDSIRVVPPVFMPRRLEKLIELGREPMPTDVDLRCRIGGFSAPLPVYLSAFGSTRIASTELGVAASQQAGRLGIPMVVGENVMPINGSGRLDDGPASSLLGRIRSYVDQLPDNAGGLCVQQSTEDADAEVWNLVYSDPSTLPLVESGRLAFELKVGQGAKPGLGGLTIVDPGSADRMRDRYTLDDIFGPQRVLRYGTPGTFTEEIVRQQIRLMRNNFPRARVWIKLPPGRDVRAAAATAWAAGADAVTVDGAEAGTGWAPVSFLNQVGLPLGECLARIANRSACLLASGRIWEGGRALKCLALGATAVGIGRAALLAIDEDPEAGLLRLVECLALELRLLISALGKYSPLALDTEDVWAPAPPAIPVHRTGLPADDQGVIHDH